MQKYLLGICCCVYTSSFGSHNVNMMIWDSAFNEGVTYRLGDRGSLSCQSWFFSTVSRSSLLSVFHSPVQWVQEFPSLGVNRPQCVSRLQCKELNFRIWGFSRRFIADVNLVWVVTVLPTSSCTKFWLENMKGRDHSEDLGMDGRTLWWILNKSWTG
jgi:hypothetical protein